MKKIWQITPWLALAAAFPFMLFPTPQRAWALLAAPLFFLLSKLCWKRWVPVTPFNLSLLLLAVMLLVSLWATYDLAVSYEKIAGVLLGMLIFLGFAQAGNTRQSWLRAWAVFLLCGVGLAGMGLLGTRWFTTKFTFMNDLTGLLPARLIQLPGAEGGIHPNELAGALTWVLPVALLGIPALWTMPRDRLKFPARWLAILFCLFISLATGAVLLLTQSRTAYLALGITLVGSIVVLFPRKLRWAAVGLTAICLVLVLGWVNRTGWDIVSNAALGAAPVEISDNAASLSTLISREEIWSRAILLIREAPLTGLGLNVFRNAVFLLFPPYGIGPDFNLGHAHNELLQVALDLGLPGLAAFLSLYLLAFLLLSSPFRSAAFSGRDGLSTRLLALGLGGGLVAHFLYGMLDAVSLGAKPGFLFWMLLGLVAGYHRWNVDRGEPQ